MDIHIFNSDLRHGAFSAESAWIDRGIAVTSGEPAHRYRNALEMPKHGDLLAMYINGQGIVAVGSFLDQEIEEVRHKRRVNFAEPVEFHRRVQWHFDLRESPIRVSQMKEMGLPYRQAKMTVRNPEAAERLKILLKKYKAVPVPSPVQLDAAAAALLACGPVLRPTGIQSPRKVELASSGCFYRDPMVRAWTLQRSGGKCECCARPAPFVDSLGMPFLESHHILPLSHGGPDVPLNTAAVCPNCHRELHHGQRKAAMTETLQELVTLAEDRWLSTVMS